MIVRTVVLGCLLCMFPGASQSQTRTPVIPNLPSAAELSQSLEKIRTLAGHGDVNAQFLLGHYLEREPYLKMPRSIEEQGKWSKDLQEKLAESRKWYGMAAEQGHVEASYALGRFRNSDPLERRRLFLFAAGKGHLVAMNALSESFRYSYGNDHPKDLRQVVYWKNRAAEGGYAEAKEDLAVWYWKGLMGLPIDYQKTRELLLGAANLGRCSAMFNMGGLYFNGDGVNQSASEAEKWFAKSKECDSKNAALRKEADKYSQRARTGDLPTPQAEGTTRPAPGSNSQTSWQEEAFMKGFLNSAVAGAIMLFLTQGATMPPDQPLPICQPGDLHDPHAGYGTQVGRNGFLCRNP